MAQGRNVARYFSATATQGSADAFVQASIDTGIIPADGVGLRVVTMEVVHGTLSAVSADGDIQWSVTRDTKTAVTGYNDDDSILYDGVWWALTTSGQISGQLLHRYPQVEGVFIVEPTIYFQLDSAATGAQNTAFLRIYYEEQRLSEVDILRILNNA